MKHIVLIIIDIMMKILYEYYMRACNVIIIYMNEVTNKLAILPQKARNDRTNKRGCKRKRQHSAWPQCV